MNTLRLLFAYHNAFNGLCPIRRIVDFEQNAAVDSRALGNIEANRHCRKEFPQDELCLDAEHRVPRSRHAEVGDVRRTLRQDSFICRLNVRMCSDDSMDASIEIKSHGHLSEVVSA